VVLVTGPDGETGYDADATARQRRQLRATRGPAAFFDRGPGYRQLSGRRHADVDLVEPAPRPRPECPRL
jgi:N-methylhydantoinase B